MNRNNLWIVGTIVGLLVIFGAIYIKNTQPPSQTAGEPQKTETGAAPKPSGGGTASPTPGTGTPTAKKTPSPTSGRLVFAVTDATADLSSIRSIFLTVSEIKVHSPQKGWITIPGGPKKFDLLELKKSASLGFFGDAYLEAGTYNQLGLTVKEIIVVKIDSTTASAKLPSGNLKFPAFLINVSQGNTVGIIFDFKADKSLHTSADGTFIFFPVIQVSIRPEVRVDILKDGKVNMISGRSALQVLSGMDKKGNMRENFLLQESVQLDFVGNVLKLRRYDLSEEGLSVSGSRAIEIATAGGLLDKVISIELKDENRIVFWEVTGTKNSVEISVYIDASSGKPISR